MCVEREGEGVSRKSKLHGTSREEEEEEKSGTLSGNGGGEREGM